MNYERCKQYIHVRSAMYRTSKPEVRYWKNHTVPLDVRIPASDKLADDWEEFDPRDHEECSEYNEMPA
jgi:hypothetical protein